MKLWENVRKNEEEAKSRQFLSQVSLIAYVLARKTKAHPRPSILRSSDYRLHCSQRMHGLLLSVIMTKHKTMNVSTNARTTADCNRLKTDLNEQCNNSKCTITANQL